MGLESATYISQLVATNPTSTDPKSQGDDHIRLVKSTLQNTFPNITGAVTVTQSDINSVTGKADVAGETYTGTHDFTGGTILADTQSLGDSSTKVATTEFVANTSFSTNLPAQSGNANKYLKTDGTNASWSTANAVNLLGGGGGQIPYQSAADTTTFLAAGTSGYYLKSNGTSPPSWQQVDDRVLLLSTTTISAGASTVDFTGLSSTYSAYILEFENVTSTGGGAELFMRTSSNNGSSFDSTAGNYYYITYANDGNNQLYTTPTAGNLFSEMRLTGNQNASSIFGTFRLQKPSSTTYYKPIVANIFWNTGGSFKLVNLTFTGVRYSTSAYNAIRFYFSGDTFAGGSIRLYGVL